MVSTVAQSLGHTFPMELWNLYQRTYDKMPRTNSVGFHHGTTKGHLQIYILVFGNRRFLMKEVTLAKKGKV